MKKKHFRTWNVSTTVHNMVVDLEMAVAALQAVDPGDREATETGYDRVNARRKELYDYLENLEAVANIKRDVTLRF